MTNDMTKGAITPLLIRFTIPLVLGNLFQLTYNAADSIIVEMCIRDSPSTASWPHTATWAARIWA